MKTKRALGLGVLVGVLATLAVFMRDEVRRAPSEMSLTSETDMTASQRDDSAVRPAVPTGSVWADQRPGQANGALSVPPDGEAGEGDWEVDAFESVTDEWKKAKAGGVTLSDVGRFVTLFRKLPPSRKDECLHRALNLIPDENVMLLVGILMDKSQDRHVAVAIFNDILNRSESVKGPIMKTVAQDRDHPCWSDAKWVLEVTGEEAPAIFSSDGT